MLTRAVATLLIGDPAMIVSRDQFRVFYLATLWYEFTGFGFIFAMWMVRKDSINKVREINFAAARDEGLANLDQIAASYSSQIGLSEDEIKCYLTENVVFSVDEEMQKGLALYFELAKKHRLIEKSKPFEFVAA